MITTLPNFVPIDCNTFADANCQGLSIVTNEHSNIKIFPNPAKTMVNILSEYINIKEILICDMQGRFLEKEKFDNTSTQFDISSYAAGNYLLSIRTELGTSNRKLIIN